MSRAVRHPSAADIERLALDPSEAREAIASVFAARHRGDGLSPPKLVLDIGPGHAFQSLCAASAELGMAANKWLGMVPPTDGAPGAIDAVVALSDLATGRLLAILDGNTITGIRTAAMSACAARFLARPDARSIGFVGCGLQARMHLAAMKALLPGLETVRAFDGARATTRAFAAEAAARGFAVEIVDDAEALVRASDVVVTSVPMRAGFTPFLDPAWIAPGAYVAAVDVARSWHPGALRAALDLAATDYHAQQAEMPVAPDLGPTGTFDADLGELAAGARPGRTEAGQRAMFVFRGSAIADLALAALAFRSAEKAGIGTVLPL